ncbi:ATP-binding cassette domain-containing protein [Paracoccus sp. (in: a-proteobacteria)]|uniref:ATP-binding cassette domain-containing protein n=1 Tax=Paracoccus sp. TaxID=267 RepID=UPI003A8637B5
MTDLHLSVRGLDKWYGSVHALRGLDLDIPKGQVVGLIGDNGAGKSTFIKILSGVHRQSAGEIFFEGSKVAIRSPRDAMNLGIETIYQYTAMIPEMSIARNVFIGREKRKWGWRGFGLLDQKAMAAEAMAAIEDVGLHLRSPDAPVKDLSGGQRQGVAIARAMHFRSSMLILDEPTNHLSVKEMNKVLDYVRQLRDQGITVIFISHNLHHVHDVSDRIVAFARGAKVADLTAAETSVQNMIDIIT